jgi:hypothetical protein
MMDTNQIIAQLDTEIARLQEVKSILSGTTTNAKLGRPNGGHIVAATAAVKHTLSPEARAKISAAQKKRWAQAKKSKPLTGRSRSGGGANSGRSQHEPFSVKAPPAVQESAAKHTISPEGRARIAAAQKARWAKGKKAAKKAA